MRRHRLDPFSLLFGFWFTVVGALYLARGRSIDALPRPGWLVPLGLVVVGAMMIGSGARRAAARAEADPAPDVSADRGADE